jgi:2-polyprenyl-3-methyl-5-hydroxy-6-metoxy-1,4-benzoquinol methylase
MRLPQTPIDHSNGGGLAPTATELAALHRSWYGPPETSGRLPRLWHRLGYYVPEMYYEAVVTKLHFPGIYWLDVGSGRNVFPANPALAQSLAQSSGLLVGVDPDEGIQHNPLVHRKVQCPIEEFVSDVPFDLVTSRMVAEHITDPERTLAALQRLTKPGGNVLLYTVNRWSPVALAAWAVPFGLHYPLKKLLWGVKSDKGTFPVVYRMNTRPTLRRLFAAHGFRERYFAYLDDCRTFHRFRPLHLTELLLRGVLNKAGMAYPENCLLGVYQRL